MPNTIKIRAKIAEDGVGIVKSIITHPMETGLRIDPQTKKRIPANHINRVRAIFHDNIVFDARLQRGVSKNPYLSFKVAAPKPGEEIWLTWYSNLNMTDTAVTPFA